MAAEEALRKVKIRGTELEAIIKRMSIMSSSRTRSLMGDIIKADSNSEEDREQMMRMMNCKSDL